MEINVVITDTFAHTVGNSGSETFSLVPLCEAKYVPQYLFDFCRQIIKHGDTDCLYCMKQLRCVEGIKCSYISFLHIILDD